MPTELKITKERVQEAASKCGDAARVLRTLFPEAFANSGLQPGDVAELEHGTRYIAVSRDMLETVLEGAPDCSIFQIVCWTRPGAESMLGNAQRAALIRVEKIIKRRQDDAT